MVFIKLKLIMSKIFYITMYIFIDVPIHLGVFASIPFSHTPDHI